MKKYAFQGGLLIDGTGAQAVENSLVLVDGDKITYCRRGSGSSGRI